MSAIGPQSILAFGFAIFGVAQNAPRKIPALALSGSETVCSLVRV